MEGSYNYEPRYWYPHLSPKEAAIWGRFIEKYPKAYTSVDYDVKIGPVPDFVAEHDDPAMREQAPLYQYKIDVIGYNEMGVDIIELKERAQFYTIGQVKGYAQVWLEEALPPEPPRCVVITERLAPKVEEHAKAEGCMLFVV